MPTPIGSRPPSPITTSHPEDKNTATQSLPSGGAARSLSKEGALSGLSARKKNFTQLPEDIHREIADRLPIADVSRLSRTGRAMHSVFGEEVKSFSSLSEKIGSTADLAELHQLTGIGASEGHETGKQTILGWNKSRQDELFLKVGVQMSNAMKGMSAIPSEKRAALLGQCMTDFCQMRPEELRAAGVFHATTFIKTALPRENQQAFFDRSLAATKAFQPANRANTLRALTTSIFRFPEPAAADSLGDARKNVVNIAKISDGIASAQLKPIVEGLAEHPNLVLLAIGQGDWQSPFNAIVETGSRLSPSDRQFVHKHLNSSLDMIESNFGSAGIDAARERLKALEPPAAE
ncbi:hypothetical protein OH764_33140 (plasmid) [Burkholderia sp. M6-3]